jgi:hypothetical protein
VRYSFKPVHCRLIATSLFVGTTLTQMRHQREQRILLSLSDGPIWLNQIGHPIRLVWPASRSQPLFAYMTFALITLT